MGLATIRLERRGRVATIILDRPESLNALNAELMAEVCEAVAELNLDPMVGAIVVTGSEKAFAAGADIKEMSTRTFEEMYRGDWFAPWDRFAQSRTPVIAAVAGYALGGGCELALMCDFIIAAETARFGQPEVKLGIVPGIGGTQRLTRAIGKAKAMDLCLTGRMMDAEEAERSGLVARVVPLAALQKEAYAAAEAIAEMSTTATLATKECIGRAFETTLAEGVRFERHLFQAMFSTRDQVEGMAAFIEKRPSSFQR